MASKGLGDSVEKVLKATGIDKIAKKVLGDDCGCKERKEALNKLYPYSRQFTEDEAIMVKLYNKVFNANKKPSSCGSCVQGTLKKLEAVYQNSCKNENTH